MGVLAGAALAALGLLIGLLYRLPPLFATDAAVMLRVNAAAFPKAVDRLLGFVRLLGTTPFFAATLTLVAIVRPAWALALGVTALLAEALTKGVKVLAHRPRPFEKDGRVIVRLPTRPVDPSYPSGDAMRAAFLAILSWVSLGPAAGAAAVVFALAVGFGRIRAGAHYPFDVLAGSSLGFGLAVAWSQWVVASG